MITTGRMILWHRIQWCDVWVFAFPGTQGPDGVLGHMHSVHARTSEIRFLASTFQFPFSEGNLLKKAVCKKSWPSVTNILLQQKQLLRTALDVVGRGAGRPYRKCADCLFSRVHAVYV